MQFVILSVERRICQMFESTFLQKREKVLNFTYTKKIYSKKIYQKRKDLICK